VSIADWTPAFPAPRTSERALTAAPLRAASEALAGTPPCSRPAAALVANVRARAPRRREPCSSVDALLLPSQIGASPDRARSALAGRPIRESWTRGSDARQLSHCQRPALSVCFRNAGRSAPSTLGLGRPMWLRDAKSAERRLTATAAGGRIRCEGLVGRRRSARSLGRQSDRPPGRGLGTDAIVGRGTSRGDRRAWQSARSVARALAETASCSKRSCLRSRQSRSADRSLITLGWPARGPVAQVANRRSAATCGPRPAFTGGFRLPPHHPGESAIR
jgi:hypothetical protein